MVLPLMPSRKSETSSPLSRVRDLLKRPLKLEVRGASVQVVLGGAHGGHGASTGGSSAGAQNCGR